MSSGYLDILLFGLFLFCSSHLSVLVASHPDSLLSVCADPPSVITEHFAYVRKASSETALSCRAAISAFFCVCVSTNILLKCVCMCEVNTGIPFSPGSYYWKMGSWVNKCMLAVYLGKGRCKSSGASAVHVAAEMQEKK